MTYWHNMFLAGIFCTTKLVFQLNFFLVTKQYFGHNCNYCHYCHYCHYSHYYNCQVSNDILDIFTNLSDQTTDQQKTNLNSKAARGRKKICAWLNGLGGPGNISQSRCRSLIYFHLQLMKEWAQEAVKVFLNFNMVHLPYILMN